MKKPLTKSAVCLLAVSAICPWPDAVAQTTASCLPSPSTVDCDEPVVAAGTSATIIPAFPNPSPTCEIVTNACSFDFAVPVATQQEWSSFLQSSFVNTQGSCASLLPCAVTTNGVCGCDNGQSLASPPTNLCNSGTPSAVSGNNPWSWTCVGIDGGASASCSTSGASCAAAKVVTPVTGGGLPPTLIFTVPAAPNGAVVTGQNWHNEGVCGYHYIYATFTCENGGFVAKPQQIFYGLYNHGYKSTACGWFMELVTIP